MFEIGGCEEVWSSIFWAQTLLINLLFSWYHQILNNTTRAHTQINYLMYEILLISVTDEVHARTFGRQTSSSQSRTSELFIFFELDWRGSCKYIYEYDI